MRIFRGCAWLLVVLACPGWAQQSDAKNPSAPKQQSGQESPTKLQSLLESKVTTEWEAFKKRDKKAYGDLLAEDFEAVEDDNQGLRKKFAAVEEVDRSVVANYHLFALKVMPLSSNAAFVIYELTLEFPPRSVVRFKRVLVSELWLQRDGQWKERYYQETHAR